MCTNLKTSPLDERDLIILVQSSKAWQLLGEVDHVLYGSVESHLKPLPTRLSYLIVLHKCSRKNGLGTEVHLKPLPTRLS